MDNKLQILPNFSKDIFGDEHSESTEIVEIPSEEDALDIVEKDFQKVRKSSLDSLDVANDALKEIAGIAYASQDAEAYDSLFRSIKTISEVSKTILELSEKRKNLSKTISEKETSPQTINNNLILTTKELQDRLKDLISSSA